MSEINEQRIKNERMSVWKRFTNYIRPTKKREGMRSMMREIMMEEEFIQKVSERIVHYTNLSYDIASVISVSEIAEEFDIYEIANELDSHEIARSLEVTDIVYELDYCDLANNLDYDSLAQSMDVDYNDLAIELDYDELASSIDVQGDLPLEDDAMTHPRDIATLVERTIEEIGSRGLTTIINGGA